MNSLLETKNHQAIPSNKRHLGTKTCHRMNEQYVSITGGFI